MLFLFFRGIFSQPPSPSFKSARHNFNTHTQFKSIPHSFVVSHASHDSNEFCGAYFMCVYMCLLVFVPPVFSSFLLQEQHKIFLLKYFEIVNGLVIHSLQKHNFIFEMENIFPKKKVLCSQCSMWLQWKTVNYLVFGGVWVWKGKLTKEKRKRKWNWHDKTSPEQLKITTHIATPHIILLHSPNISIYLFISPYVWLYMEKREKTHITQADPSTAVPFLVYWRDKKLLPTFSNAPHMMMKKNEATKKIVEKNRAKRKQKRMQRNWKRMVTFLCFTVRRRTSVDEKDKLK